MIINRHDCIKELIRLDTNDNDKECSPLLNRMLENTELDIDEEILIGKIDKQINKMIKSNRKYSSNILKSKIYNNLYNNGFDKDMIINILNNYNF